MWAISAIHFWFEFTWILSHPTKGHKQYLVHWISRVTCDDDLARSSESLFFFANIKHSQDWSGERYRFRTDKLNPCKSSRKKVRNNGWHAFLICSNLFRLFVSPLTADLAFFKETVSRDEYFFEDLLWKIGIFCTCTHSFYKFSWKVV